MTDGTRTSKFAINEQPLSGDIRLGPGMRNRGDPLAALRPTRRINTQLGQDLIRQLDRSVSSVEPTFSFGPFRLLPAQRLLFKGDKVVRLGSRALDILIALIERRGDLVSKGELMARVWPSTFVEPANLTVQITLLRRALGDGAGGHRYLVNTPGQGYRFVAAVDASEEPRSSTLPALSMRRVRAQPAPLTRLIGRAEIVGALAAQLSWQRFITIVGPGGIGKSSVALAVAEALTANYAHGVWRLDLAPLRDPALAPISFASGLGLDIRSGNSLAGLIAALGDRRMLLVLDNCEHVIEAAATLAVAVLKAAPGVQILATSRQPLHARGEAVRRLPPLESPAPSVRPGACDALRFAAVQLFVERATAAMGEFELCDADAPVVAEICSNLDGNPLAIELAAARVDVFGVRGLATRLTDRFRLLTSRHRKTLPRHQTISASLDWSYDLLPEQERAVLLRISVCAGGFTAEAAGIIAGDGFAASDVVDCVEKLVAKSLVNADISASTARYWLSETTRAYALTKLKQRGEFERVARVHAEYYRDLFEQAEAEWETRPTSEWIGDYRRWIENVRTALNWAFSPGGDQSLGVTLTATSAPLWLELSLMEECRRQVERALLGIHSGSCRGGRREMQLCAALGASLMFTKGPGPEISAAYTNALEIAEKLGDGEYRLRALWGLWSNRVGMGDYRAALALAQRFRSYSAKTADKADWLIGEQMTGLSLHLFADQTAARHHIERMLGCYVAPLRRSHAVRFQLDQRIAARVTLGRILWLQGFADQAKRIAQSAVEDALAAGHALSLCYALAAAACPIAFLTGNVEAADRFAAMLVNHSASHELPLWILWAALSRPRYWPRKALVASGCICSATRMPSFGTPVSPCRRRRFRWS